MVCVYICMYIYSLSLERQECGLQRAWWRFASCCTARLRNIYLSVSIYIYIYVHVYIYIYGLAASCGPPGPP